MSWKSLVSAGLLCLLAVPAWAVPSVTIRLARSGDPNTGPVLLDSNGDYQWQVIVNPDATAAGAGAGTIGAELAFLLGSGGSQGLASASENNAAQWDQDNPGARPTTFGSGFAWLVNGVSGDPEGLQQNTTTDEVFAALGSINFANGNASNYISIKGVGPSRTANIATRRTTLQWGGAYAGGTGLLGQDLAGTANDKTLVSGSSTYTAVIGDVDLSGTVALADFNAVVNNFGMTGDWRIGNFNNTKAAGGDTTVNLADFNDVVNFFGSSTPGAGSGGLAIPEPASVGLLMIALSLVAAARRR